MSKSAKKPPSLLAFSRSLSPSHFLMYSAAAVGAAELTPVSVREEPLRGLNATSKTTNDEKVQAVLQVVESAELAAGHEVLVLQGRVLVRNQSHQPHSCNDPQFVQAHQQVLAAFAAENGHVELARRYAVNLACGNFAWRNALEAESVRVQVEWPGNRVVFENLLPDTRTPFDFAASAYDAHRGDLERLSQALASALMHTGCRGTSFRVRVDLVMGLGARVYPSQEWSSKTHAEESKQRWDNEKGVTRVLAKHKLADGSTQAIVNDRKVGNALRVIDTWYPEGDESRPIAVEPFGASAHEARAFRPTTPASFFSLVEKVAAAEALTPQERLYYVAVCIRGGVFGAKQKESA